MFKYNEYIYQVYIEKSFSKAAKSLFISQPSLSNIVKKVEEDLGIVIFDRKSNPIELTPAGKVYIGAIEKIMEIEKTTKENLNKFSISKDESFTICGPSYFCTSIFPEIIEKYSEIDPEIKIKIIEIGTDEIEEILKFKLGDLGACVEKLNSKLFEQEKWFEEELILAVPRSNPINKGLEEFSLSYADLENFNKDYEKKYVDLKKFKDEKFIFLKKGNDLHDRSIKICLEYGFVPDVLIYMDQLQSSYNLAKAGRGLVFIRDGLIGDNGFDDLCFYRIKSDYAKRNVNLTYLKNKVFSKREKDFIEFLKKL